jgi:hypothetical protein
MRLVCHQAKVRCCPSGQRMPELPNNGGELMLLLSMCIVAGCVAVVYVRTWVLLLLLVLQLSNLLCALLPAACWT